MTFAKILVPLDGSRVAEAALPKAEELVKGHPEATMMLLRAVEAKVCPGVDPIDAQVSVVHEAEDYLESVAERLRASGVPTVRTSVWYGAAAPAILDTARRGKPDLIVMSTHGRRGMTRLIAGSVAESVLRETRTPIFLIRVEHMPDETPDAREDAREQEAAHVQPRAGVGRLLFGPVAEAVLRQAHVPVLMMRLAPHQLPASDVA